MPGLARTDDRTFVHAMQEMNVAIVNPVFLLSFLGAPALAGAAVAASRPSARPWAIAGAALALGTVAITAFGNIPLNNALDAAGPVDRMHRPRRRPRGVREPVGRGSTRPRGDVDVLARLPGRGGAAVVGRAWGVRSRNGCPGPEQPVRCLDAQPSPASPAGRGSAASKSLTPAVHSAPTASVRRTAANVMTWPIVPPRVWVVGGSQVVSTKVSAIASSAMARATISR